jgi:hypothetical protein
MEVEMEVKVDTILEQPSSLDMQQTSILTYSGPIAMCFLDVKVGI